MDMNDLFNSIPPAGEPKPDGTAPDTGERSRSRTPQRKIRSAFPLTRHGILPRKDRRIPVKRSPRRRTPLQKVRSRRRPRPKKRRKKKKR